MKNYLEIKSFGEIDVQAFTLLGASTKANDSSKIGMYGSGNKYAIAALIRQGISFKVFSGEDEIVFTTTKQSFRDNDFEVILVNGTETSLTTSMGGKDWDSAFAPIREIYSNALDEDDGAKVASVTELTAEKGYTKFMIEMTEDVSHFYKNLHLYFCNANPKVLSSNDAGSVFSNTDQGSIRIFRKGILAHLDTTQRALFHYNILDITINESRVLSSMWEAYSEGARILKICEDESVINTLLMALKGSNSGLLEHRFNWDNWRDFSDTWFNVLKNTTLAPVEYREMFSEEELKGALSLPVALIKPLKAQFPDLTVLGLGSKSKDFFVEITPSQILLDKVIDAMAVLNSSRYKHRLESPTIKYVKFQENNIFGLASEGSIYLSTKLDTYAVSAIAKIIIEENEHNLTGFSDETRGFQDHLFDLYFDELTK
jgi:hypothetical protein